mmetsp:Transcript_50906/g.88804  ORF Transcript_50906/g.88804 Transcript_50906/m.88804 type:complete len:371 (+) Transcript_50906:95-1207(+)
MEQFPGSMEQAVAQELFFRTRMCKFFLAGKCKRGKLCSFAHGEAKVQPLPDFYKTRFCIAFLRTGKCSSGEECSFAHNKSEIRDSVQPIAAASKVSQLRSGNPKKDKHSALSQPDSPSSPPTKEAQAESWDVSAAALTMPLPQRPMQQQPEFPRAAPAVGRQHAIADVQASMTPQFYQSVIMTMHGATATQSATAGKPPGKPQSLGQATERMQLQTGWDLEQMVRPKKAPLLKVDMCKFFLQGMCMRGASCTFAHSKSDLRPRPNFYRTMPCFKFMKEGKCSPDCKYNHSMHKDQKGDSGSRDGSSEDLGSHKGFSRQSTADVARSSNWSRQSTTDHGSQDLNFDVKNTFLVFQDRETMGGTAVCRSHSA